MSLFINKVSSTCTW